uniref:Uncharacterized protein n=1 Tax=Caenorhabditis japonica TaxID=281687 RepID=A0A8R1EL10_CAEJA
MLGKQQKVTIKEKKLEEAIVSTKKPAKKRREHLPPSGIDHDYGGVSSGPCRPRREEENDEEEAINGINASEWKPTRMARELKGGTSLGE